MQQGGCHAASTLGKFYDGEINQKLLKDSVNLISANHLEQWADTLSGRSDLPGLVATLIRASAPSIEGYRFPSGDASQTHGFDGIADVLEGALFVPSGRSVWEFGAGKNYKTKATEDYKKRTEQLTAAERERKDQSFIFVTPRVWHTDLAGWESERKDDGWKSVRIIDAIGLETWLSENPAVAYPFAVQLGLMPPSGVQTVEQFWEEYRASFKPALSTDLLLTGREQLQKLVCDGMSTGVANLTRWKADSAMEAAAFIAACVLAAEPELSRFLISKTLFIETDDAVRRLPSTNHSNLICFPTASKVGSVRSQTNQVLLVFGNGERADSAQVLERLNTRDFASGLRSMGVDEEEAFRLAVTCGRSLTVLSRIKASGLKPLPIWHDDIDLIPLSLAGAWDATNEHDRAVIEQLCDKPYDSVDAAARRFASIPDAPIDLEGTVWAMRSPTDAFTLLGRLINSATQARLRRACVDVFSETDRTLDLPDEQRPAVPTRGADFKHSEWLRRGLATTLLLISGLHEAAEFRVIERSPERYVDDVVEAMIGLPANSKLIASLKLQFPILAEAAPVPLVSALEQMLEGDSRSWVPVIFRDKKDGSLWGSFSPHTYLLWALETIAWSPRYLYRAASLLMRMAECDPGGATQNRPLSSLRDIFLAWRPHTFASLDERLGALRQICKASPRTGLVLVMSLLPQNHDHTTGTAKPRLRDFGDAGSKPTTQAEMHSAFGQYADLAVELSSTDIRGLTALINHFPQLNRETRERIFSAIHTVAPNADSEEVFDLWTTLNDLIQKHEQFQEAAWAMPLDQLEPLKVLREELRPKDPIRPILWLFDNYVPRLGRSSANGYIEESNRERSVVLGKLLQEHGLEKVLDLAAQSKLPHFVGLALADAAGEQKVVQDALSRSKVRSDISDDFSIAISSRAHELFGATWDDWLAAFAMTLTPSDAAALFFRWADTRETWQLVAALGTEIENEYWKRKPVFRQAADDDFFFALRKYRSVSRFSACIDMAAYETDRLSAEDSVQILTSFIEEANSDSWRLQQTQYEVVHMIQSLQKRTDIELEQIAILEYRYLPLLQFQAEPVALQRLMCKSPQFFMDVVSSVFLPSSRDEAPVLTDATKVNARLGYQILQSFKTVPGFIDNAEDVNHLRAWISEVRRLANEADRADITDQQIGQVLAHAPNDPSDGAWPTTSVRNLIEEVSSKQIETGIAVGRYNMRGVFTKGLFDGGNQERALADEYRSWSKLVTQWPRTASMLAEIAESWLRSAHQADTQMQLDQLR